MVEKILDDNLAAIILQTPVANGLPCLALARQKINSAASGLSSSCARCRTEAQNNLAQGRRLIKDCLRGAAPEMIAAIKQALNIDRLTLVYVSAADPSLSTTHTL